MNKIKVFEAFAGYGGASFALNRADIPHEVIGFSETDKFADQLYKKNFPDTKNYGDIKKIDPDSLPDFDLFTGGFPCQPFSQVGLGKGEQDTRGTLFHSILKICEKKAPKHILLENVKGLVSKRYRKTLQTIVLKLEKKGYQVTYNLLNSKDFGIPQNRERVWIYAYKGELDTNFNLVPKRKKLENHFKDFLDKCPSEDLFKSQEQIKRLEELYDLNFVVDEPCCADLYNKKIRKDGLSVTILEPHHNKMRVVHPPKDGKLSVRKYSINEHFRFMGFKDGEIDFCNQSYQQLCKRAANGWDINIVTLLFEIIFKKKNYEAKEKLHLFQFKG